MKKNKKLILAIVLPCVIFAGILIFDLLTKHFIVKALPEVGDSQKFLPGFINFIFVKNTGAAWGVLGGRPVFLIVVSIIIFALYLTFYILRVKKMKNKSSMTFAVSMGLIAGGFLGNFIDRVAFGYVRDFINFEFIKFPVFNIADISLTFGIILLVIYFIFIYLKEDKTEDELKAEKNLKNQSQPNQIEIESFDDNVEMNQVDDLENDVISSDEQKNDDPINNDKIEDENKVDIKETNINQEISNKEEKDNKK